MQDKADRPRGGEQGHHPCTEMDSLLASGVLGTADRKAEISAALSGIPHIELQLRTVEEVAAQENHGRQRTLQNVARPESQSSAPPTKPEKSGTQNAAAGAKQTSDNGVIVRLTIDEQLQALSTRRGTCRFF